MKKAIIFAALICMSIAVQQEASAGIAGIITHLKGECEDEDENGVRFCSSRKTGDIYCIYKGIAFNSYPDLKKD